MLFSKDMSDFEKLMFAEDYITLLKKELKKQENNKLIYTNSLNEIRNLFKKVSPKFAKVSSYRNEMQSHQAKARKATILADKLEGKNYQLRQKVRDLNLRVEQFETKKID